jgi:trk system potassium uptake protein TrkA
MKRFIIIGLGNFGSGVSEALTNLGEDVVALDIRPENVDRIAPFVTRAAVGDGKDVKTLDRVGARDADSAVISTGDDITASVLTTLALRDVGVKEIYVKVISTDHARVMEKIGATETIFPERESALRLGKRISSMTLLNYVELARASACRRWRYPTPG